MLYSPLLRHHQLPLITPLPHRPQLPKTQCKAPSYTHEFPPRSFLHSFFAHNPCGRRKSSLDSSSLNSQARPSPDDDDFDVELDRLLALLPEGMRRRVSEHPELYQLIEVVMDLGRKPLARFPSGDFLLSDLPITAEDLEHATSKVGDFAFDNRAGISRTLHRISAIRNRKGAIIGLTCRVGRAISGIANLLQDLVQDGSSLLLIGPPGVGKTTIIREIARMLANDYRKRVMIVDTSNEIGGDGDIPHAGIGNARRMQVPSSEVQHKVLIEAVENHMPQVIVIDEIGTKLEAMAASTIAQRGIQLVATAHGVTIENLTMNPALEMLVGGIQLESELLDKVVAENDWVLAQVMGVGKLSRFYYTFQEKSVTLGDEEASRRGVQKTVLERKGPSTFNCGVEIISKTELRVHRSLESTVDAILSVPRLIIWLVIAAAGEGRFPNVEVRKMNSQDMKETTEREPFIFSPSGEKSGIVVEDSPEMINEQTDHDAFTSEVRANMGEDIWEGRVPLRLFVYGILEASVTQAIKQLKLNDAAVLLTDNISEADALLALQTKIKKNSRIQAAAKSHDIPIYVTKTSSLVQITKAIRTLTNDLKDGLKEFEPLDEMKLPEKLDALEEARIAIEQVVIPKGEAMELLPRPSNIISLQMDLIRKYQLEAEVIATESDGRLRILPFHPRMGEGETYETDSAGEGFDDSVSANGDKNAALEAEAAGSRVPSDSIVASCKSIGVDSRDLLMSLYLLAKVGNLGFH
ncbi:hypothetical protein CJ030_MR7G014345 [Morella rubra]|uniref:AAA+ ATPase domain-containing protein n=1 Tax=Morella rubra TaxID=262757 RepID=A0A6A1V0J1_9ROSI|nr:hypothetical protein CJ030_MR7G014317 [Morella rubra]KAB1206200.1 hypothetical protein CJ030_MR7G014345 [Morella rubra]